MYNVRRTNNQGQHEYWQDDDSRAKKAGGTRPTLATPQSLVTRLCILTTRRLGDTRHVRRGAEVAWRMRHEFTLSWRAAIRRRRDWRWA